MNTAAAIKDPVLRDAAGAPPLGAGGTFFRDDQGEMFRHPDARFQNPMVRIGVLALESGGWLAQPPGFHVDGVRHATREAALCAAVDAMVSKALKYRDNREGEGTHWNEGYANAVIDWAMGLRPEPVLRREGNGERANDRMYSSRPGAGVVIDNDEAAKEITPETLSFNDLPRIEAGEQISDPVVRFLCEAKSKRRQFPAKHTISMTNPVEDGRILTVGTCECGHVIKFMGGDYLRMDAAIEAHWRRFPDGDMTDGQGKPIKPGDGSRIPKAPRSRKAKGKEVIAAVEHGENTLQGWSNIILRKPATENPTLEALREIDAGQEISGEMARHLVGEGLAYATAKRMVLTDEGRDLIKSSDGSGLQQAAGTGDLPADASQEAVTPAAQAASDESPSAETIERKDAGTAPGPSEADIRAKLDMIERRGFFIGDLGDYLIEAGYAKKDWDRWRLTREGKEFLTGAPLAAPTEEERLDWEALWSIAWLLPVDDVVAGDMMKRGLIFAIDPADRSRGYCPTTVGQDRVEALRLLFDLDQTRKKLRGTKGAAPNGAGDAADGADTVAQPDGLALLNTTPAHGETSVSPPAQIPASAQPAQICAGDDGCAGSDEFEAVFDGHLPDGTADDERDLVLEWPSYGTFIEDKVVTAPIRGIEVPREALHPYLKPHCKDLTVWALRLGCAAIFASFGLHKTAMQLEWCRQLVRHTGSPSLCVVPLGVRHGFIKEGLQLGMDVRFIRTDAEFDELYCEGVRHFLTNYESIREGKLDPNGFIACSLDEASVLRSYGSKTFQEFLPLFAKVEFKLVATATPSPNRYKELIHYAGFLGVMDTGLALTRFFQRNSEKAGDLTLYPHKVDEFWMFMHSWAAFLQRPSDLGYSDEGYQMPPADVRWHEIPADHSLAEPERDGQAVLFRKGASSLQESAKARRDSLPARIAKMMEIVKASPDDTFLIWHDLEAEREAIEVALPGVVTITGNTGVTDLDERERRLHEFEEGRIKYFATKPILSGSGSNFQYHCHRAIYVGMPGDGYKFNDFIQSLYRLQRFGQQHAVEIDIIYAEDMRAGRAALEEKWALDTEMRLRMSEIIRTHGLNTLPLRDALLRSIGVKRIEIKGENFVAINNDSVEECRAWPESSVDQIVTSIPFATQYEYSPSYRDFGHCDDNAHFWGQMDFLSSELLRILKPGRLACIHVKDRIRFGAVTGEGVPTVEPFHAEAIMHYRAHGFQYLGMITVVTDVVRENNQTYRLGWSENAKDGTKMGVGMPEYILLLRKPQSDRSRSYADVPVTKSKDDYTRARWQVDAHAYWPSSGNRLLTPEEFAHLDPGETARTFAKVSTERVYDFEAHVRIGEALERVGKLPATFMAIAPGSRHPDVWHDINRMRTLNTMQAQKGAEKHLCPLQFDIVDRLIERYSNPGEMVLDPFGGLMSVPYRALLKGRRGAGIELSATYFLDGVKYLQMAEEKLATPALFDLAAFDAANTPSSDRLDGE